MANKKVKYTLEDKSSFHEKYPLIDHVLQTIDIVPLWCSNCPLATDTPAKNHMYYCTGMRKHIKGQSAECTSEHWKKWIKKEINNE